MNSVCVFFLYMRAWLIVLTFCFSLSFFYSFVCSKRSSFFPPHTSRFCFASNRRNRSSSSSWEGSKVNWLQLQQQSQTMTVKEARAPVIRHRKMNLIRVCRVGGGAARLRCACRNKKRSGRRPGTYTYISTYM